MASGLSLAHRNLRQNPRLGLHAHASKHSDLCDGSLGHGELVLGSASFFANIDYLVVQTIRSHFAYSGPCPMMCPIKTHLGLTKPRHVLATKTANHTIRSHSACIASFIALVAHQ